MGIARFRGNKVYKEFVSYANMGDKLLDEVIDEVIVDSDFSVSEKHTLLLYLKSNKFYNCQRKTVNLSNRVKNIRGDIAEAYIA